MEKQKIQKQIISSMSEIGPYYWEFEEYKNLKVEVLEKIKNAILWSSKIKWKDCWDLKEISQELDKNLEMYYEKVRLNFVKRINNLLDSKYNKKTASWISSSVSPQARVEEIVAKKQVANQIGKNKWDKIEEYTLLWKKYSKRVLEMV